MTKYKLKVYSREPDQIQIFKSVSLIIAILIRQYTPINIDKFNNLFNYIFLLY